MRNLEVGEKFMDIKDKMPNASAITFLGCHKKVVRIRCGTLGD